MNALRNVYLHTLIVGVALFAGGPFRSAAIAAVDLNASTSLVLVQTDAGGGPVLRYVRGESAYTAGYAMEQAQPVGLETLPSYTADNAPSVLRYNDVLAVAQRVGTTIRFVSAGYATRLISNEDTPPPSRVVLQSDPFGPMHSRVQLARIAGSLLITWRSGTTLRAIASQNAGQTWSAPYTLTSTPVGDDYALASDLSGESDVLVLARVFVNLPYRYIGVFWLRNPTATAQPAFTYSNPSGTNAYAGTDALRGLSIAKHGDKIFVAYAREKQIDVARYTYSTWTYETTANVLSFGPAVSHSLHGVTIHPSPYGWALQYVVALNTVSGIRYYTYGLRSDDGLTYGTTTWQYNGPSSVNFGPTSMTLATVPTPWIWKYHDSGRLPTSAFNLVITGDGYTYAERTTFFTQAKLTADRLLSLSPFAENKHLFNIWIIATFSKQSGADVRDPASACTMTLQAVDTMFDAYTCGGALVVPYYSARHSRRMLSGLLPWNPAVAPVVRDIALVNRANGGTGGSTTWFGAPAAASTNPDPVSGWRYYASDVPFHEGLHGNLFAHPDYTGNTFTADQERYFSFYDLYPPINVTTNATLSGHPWSYWFTTIGPAPSVVMSLSDDFRAKRYLGRATCQVSANESTYAWFYANTGCTVLTTTNHPALQPGTGCTPPAGGFVADQCIRMGDPTTSNPYTGSYQRNALTLFNPGLYENQYVGNYSGASRWYSPSYAGFMYSLMHKSYFLDPVTAEGIVASLNRWASGSYTPSPYRNAGGATLKVHLKRKDTVYYGAPMLSEGTWKMYFPWGLQRSCAADYGTTLRSLEDLGGSFQIQVGNATYSLADMTLYHWDNLGVDDDVVAHLALPDVPAGTSVSITLRSTRPNAGAPSAWLWIPGIEIVNARGARYTVQPATAHVTALSNKKSGDCHFEAWDLQRDGPFTLTYTSKGPR